MAETKTYTGTLHAWLPKNHSIDGLFDSNMSPETIVSEPLLTTIAPSAEGEPACYWEKEGYTYIGTAQVTLNVADRDTVITQKVASLRAQKSAVMAEASAEATRIEQQIQKLLAISFDAEALA